MARRRQHWCTDQHYAVLDIDILSPDAAQAAEDLVRARFEDDGGDIVIRIGLPPKRAIPFRTDTPFKKIDVPLIAPNGDKSQKIEFLANRQQCVVDGVHPDTKKPYAWFDRSLVDIPRNELPHITGEQARQLVDDIVELLAREHGYTVSSKQKKPSGEPGENNDPLDWAELTANIFNGQSLHDSARDLAASWIGAGMSSAHVLRLLHALMRAGPTPKNKRWQERIDDLHRIVRSAEEKFGKPAAPAIVKLRIADMSTWDQTRAPAREWWMENFPLRQPALISGEGGIGKTILVLQGLVATVLRTQWLERFATPAGPAIFLSAEDDEDELHRRLEPILDYHKRKFADLIEGGFTLMPYAGEDAVLGHFDKVGRIQPTPLFNELYEKARVLRPRIIAIDTVSDGLCRDQQSPQPYRHQIRHRPLRLDPMA